jgi:hypothetical protein
MLLPQAVNMQPGTTSDLLFKTPDDFIASAPFCIP